MHAPTQCISKDTKRQGCHVYRNTTIELEKKTEVRYGYVQSNVVVYVVPCFELCRILKSS